MEAAPDRWRISRKDGRSTLIHGHEKKGVYSVTIGFEEIDENEKAAANCPAKVIKIVK